MNGSPPARKLSWEKTFAALKHRNYRLWFWGQMTSLFGTWMQTTAQGFLIFQLTRSSAFLGYVGFTSGIPSWLFMMYGGVIADRMPRQRLLIITQSVMMILAFILAALTFTGIVQPWHILLLAFGLGLANAFDSPARQAFVSELVEREDMTNAIALNATMFNSATAVGPAIAGIIYALLGPAWCFTINGLSFIAVIVALALMHIQQPVTPQYQRSTYAAMKEGIDYIIHEPIVRVLIGLVATASLFGMSLATLIPAWSVKILHGNAATNGFLFSARGVGSLIGALSIASMGRSFSRGKFITVGSLLFPLFIAIFAMIHWLPGSLLLMAFIGFSTIYVMNLCNASIQSLVPDYLRGRVMGVYSTIFLGAMPLGALFLGTIAEKAGEAQSASMSAGIAFAITLLIWLTVPKIRLLK